MICYPCHKSSIHPFFALYHHHFHGSTFISADPNNWALSPLSLISLFIWIANTTPLVVMTSAFLYFPVPDPERHRSNGSRASIQAFENTSTSVAASQMRNALNNLTDTVKDPEERKVRLWFPKYIFLIHFDRIYSDLKLRWTTILLSSVAT